ncbi:MAG: hypothetical protein ACI4T1_01340 [Christensenellales bacterium]
MLEQISENISNFFLAEKINENSVRIQSPFYIINTPLEYNIIVTQKDEELIIHDGGTLVHDINEQKLYIDQNNLVKLLERYPNLSYTDNIIRLKTNMDDLVCDIAKFIQILTIIIN